MYVEKEPRQDRYGRPVPDDFDWRFIPMSLLFIGTFWGVVGLIGLGATAAYNALFLRVHEVPVYAWGGVAVLCFFLAVLVCALRDLRNWRSVAWLQILLSVAGGVTSLLGTNFSVSGIVGFGAAVFAGADGLKRLKEISEAEVRRARGGA